MSPLLGWVFEKMRVGLARRAMRAVGVHPNAHVHPSARLHPTATVLAGAYVGPRCELMPGSVIGEGSIIGEGTVVGVNSSVEHSEIGAHSLLHAGVRIGADGFGFFFDHATGSIQKKPQLLRVLMGEGVEVGANTCIDRGSWRDTRIGSHTKIDNLVQIGHNVLVGEGCLICAQSGLAGSAELGDYSVMGGRSAIADHVKVCARVRLAANAGVTKHITVPGDYAGFPAQPAGQWRRQIAIAAREAACQRERNSSS